VLPCDGFARVKSSTSGVENPPVAFHAESLVTTGGGTVAQTVAPADADLDVTVSPEPLPVPAAVPAVPTPVENFHSE
jgi:hypothetical protein